MKTMQINSLIVMAWIGAACGTLSAAEFHVATNGSDTHPGTRKAPLRTIQRAADLAQPGDTITVHEGVYRERVNPPRGGTSDRRRITYRAARGARVEIKGSEVIRGWEPVRDGVWRVTLPHAFFGTFNPYTNEIRGDWFNPKGRKHHTGAVYLNGDWLTEAATLEEVLLPEGRKPDWVARTDTEYLLNVAWLRPVMAGSDTARIPSAGFAAQQGVQTAECSEGGDCVGWIEPGDWVRYDRVDFGAGAAEIEIRAASATQGGIIELRLDGPEGELLGTAAIEHTGGWQRWRSFKAKVKSVSGSQSLCLVFRSHATPAGLNPAINPNLWFAEVDDSGTTLWAQFPGVDPNAEQVEINVRQSVFYPDQPGRNYLTVRGFTMRHAATPWAPPTAEQIGLIGTHWSRGWIIEDNSISHSVCTGITLGKHGDAFDNTSADTAEGYVKTIERAHAFHIPWTREHIGHHLVRNNTIAHCEQAGIVGSMGCAFSLIENNVIHDIHVRRLFSGAEMAGIKFHGAIDTVIRNNHVHRTCRGLWLDWMTQGTRVTANLFHDNPDQDVFVEVNHGPFLFDNNLLLSRVSLLDWSEGGAYAHNLFAGTLISRPEPDRETPWHPPHSTAMAGLAPTTGGDNRFHNNIFVGTGKPDEAQAGSEPATVQTHGSGTWVYEARAFPSLMAGNVYYFGARPYADEANALNLPHHDPAVELTVTPEGRVELKADFAGLNERPATPRTTTAVLGRTRVADLPYVNPDGSPIRVDRDYFGKRRHGSHPTPGPLEGVLKGEWVFPPAR